MTWKRLKIALVFRNKSFFLILYLLSKYISLATVPEKRYTKNSVFPQLRKGNKDFL